ncbi:MAG: glycosyltransferase family 4 protein, partial [bacterium]|nr:glycosyltransferase family 4 protein [bacterium]
GVQRFGVKAVLDDFLRNKYRWEVELLRKIQKFVANRAKKIIVPSEYLKRVVTRWGIRPEKISVVYNTFQDNELFRFPRMARGGFAKPAQQLIDSRLIVSAGRLVPWKGFGALIEIMPEILKEIPEARLIIIGDGPEYKNLKLKIQNLKLEDRIIMVGNLTREKVLEYLVAADVFALNTAYEGFSHQILEAMALGVPVVTTDSGGNPELIEDGESGFLLKFNDKEALKEKIIELLSNNFLAQKLSKNAKKKAAEFSKERMIKGTIRAFCG